MYAAATDFTNSMGVKTATIVNATVSVSALVPDWSGTLANVGYMHVFSSWSSSL